MDENRPVFSVRLRRFVPEEKRLIDLLEGWRDAYHSRYGSEESWLKALLLTLFDIDLPPTVRDTYRVIERFYAVHGVMPSIAAVARRRKLSWRQTHIHFKRLERAGLIIRHGWGRYELFWESDHEQVF